MKPRTLYDLAIIGAGASGLQFLYEYFQNSENISKSVLLIDSGDRTSKSWCFWQEKNQTSFPFLIEKSWSNISYKSSSGVLKTAPVHPLNYNYISSERFFDYFFNEFIPNHPNIHCERTLAISLNEKPAYIEINCENSTNFQALCVADSRIKSPYATNDQSAKQHFWGKFVEFEEEKFNEESATIMDFSLDASNEEQAVFHYILPFSKKYALIETTLFTLASFNEEKYDEIWLKYMQTNFPDQTYKIISTEKGSIPMRLSKHESFSDRIFMIGGDNGFTKASTGYAFARMHANAKSLIHQKVPKKHHARFRFYDSMLLSVIHHEVEQIPAVMDRLFDQIPFPKILQFLDEKSNLKDEIQIFSQLNILLFLKHLLKLHK